MDAHWFNYLLAKYLHEPKQASIVPQYVLDNMRYELDVFVNGTNTQLKQMNKWDDGIAFDPAGRGRA